MEGSNVKIAPNPSLLQSKDLHQYILKTSVYPREPPPLKELREATANHPLCSIATEPDSAQLLALLLKQANAKKTIEIGVYTGYSLLLTALTIPEDGRITAIDLDMETFKIGLPFIQKAGVERKINYIQSLALPILDQLVQKDEELESFDFVYVDADKENYMNYHEKLMKLLKPGGLIVYDNTLWGGYVALQEDDVPEFKRQTTRHVLEFNELISADHRVDLVQVSIGDGMTICRRNI